MFDLDHQASAPQGFPWRLFLTLFLPVALLILGGAWYVGNERVQEEMSLTRSSEISNVVMGVRRLDDELRVPLAQLRRLASEPLVREVAETGSLAALGGLEGLFSRLVAYNDLYEKVRWIDAAGQEVVRVNNVDGQPVAVGGDQLQARAGTAYVKESLALKPGEIYISPLDLNVEHGEVERPYKPVLRLATPIHGADGQARGVLVLNVAATRLLDAFTISLVEARDRAMLLNSEGYWLKSTDPEREWGFALGREDTLGTRFPEAWSAISALPSGQEILQDGLWTWSTVYPLKVDDSRDARHIPHWWVVTHVPRDQLDHFAGNAWKTVGIYTVLLLVLYGALAAWLARSVLGRARAVSEAARAHAEAESALALSKAQERFRLVVEANTNGLLAVDEKGVMALVNPALAAMFGYRTEELLGQPMDILLPESVRPHHGQFLRSYMANPVARPMGHGRELMGQRKDGSLFPIEISLSPFHEEGKLFVDAFVADISERKQVEALHQKIEARLQLMMQTNPNGLLVVDDQGAIEMANPALERMFGYGPGELLNQSLEKLVPEAQRGGHAKLRQAYLEDPVIRPMGAGSELHGVRKDGSSFPVRVSLAGFQENGRVYVQATVIDMGA